MKAPIAWISKTGHFLIGHRRKEEAFPNSDEFTPIFTREEFRQVLWAMLVKPETKH